MITRIKTVNVCFYCKKPVSSFSDTCQHCGSDRLIKVGVKVTKLTPWYNFWSPKYQYEVVNKRYKYIEKYL